MPYEVPDNYRAPKADIFFAILIIIIIAALYFVSTETAKAEPWMPSNPGAVQKVRAGDVLNPEFPAVPSADVAHDDAFARAVVALAGEPGAVASTNALPLAVQPVKQSWWRRLLFLKPDEEIDPVKTSGLAAAVVVGVMGVMEADDQLEGIYGGGGQSEPPPSAVVAPRPGPSVGDRSVLTITGTFTGSIRAEACGAFTPTLQFATGVNGGSITSYASSRTCAGGGGAKAGWAPDNVNRIIIYCDDPFYNGPAVIVITSRAELVLDNGARLSGGVITIAPELQTQVGQ